MRINAIVGLMQNFKIYNMKAEIIHQEAYVAITYLNIEFKYNDKIYLASANCYNGSGIENLEVYEIENEHEIVSDEIQLIGEDLLFNMDIDSNITF